MTVSSGFFNSVNHDRRYDAEQFSSLFDGLIHDGVFESIGDAFRVTAYADAPYTVIVGTGRAWFDHTWTLNDSQYAITLTEPNEALGRIDAIVLDVDRTQEVRKNSIVYIQGDYLFTPEYPELIKSDLHNQYPLAYIHVDAGSDFKLSNSDIEIKVGTSECPYVLGIIEAINEDLYWQQLDASFDEWWDDVKAVIDENAVLNLQNQINDIRDDVDAITSSTVTAEDFEKISNVSLTSVNISAFPEGTAGGCQTSTHFLPDGKVLVVHNKTISNSLINYDVVARITNTNGTTGADTIIYTPGSNEIVSGLAYLSADDDAYPATFNFAFVVVAWTQGNTSDRRTITKMELKLAKLSVSSTGVISPTVTSLKSETSFEHDMTTENMNLVAMPGGAFDTGTYYYIPLWFCNATEGWTPYSEARLYQINKGLVLTNMDYQTKPVEDRWTLNSGSLLWMYTNSGKTEMYVAPIGDYGSFSADSVLVYSFGGEYSREIGNYGDNIENTDFSKGLPVNNSYFMTTSTGGPTNTNSKFKNNASGGYTLDGTAYSVPTVSTGFSYNLFSAASLPTLLPKGIMTFDRKLMVFGTTSASYIVFNESEKPYSLISRPLAKAAFITNDTYYDCIGSSLLCRDGKTSMKIGNHYLIITPCRVAWNSSGPPIRAIDYYVYLTIITLGA